MSATPQDQGYALPAMTPTVSRAAAAVRVASIAASIRANDGAHEIRGSSRFVLDQDDLPCCVSCALACAMEIMNPSWPPVAPLFHYHMTRFKVIGGANSAGLLVLSKALATLEKKGICRKPLHDKPFTELGAADPPTDGALADALTRRLAPIGSQSRYERARGPSKSDWIREQLLQDRPVVIGIQLPMTYPDSFLNSNFEWLEPHVQLSIVGHCVLATGYNHARGVFRIQDSHGEGKFQRGCWWLGYRVVDSQIFQDAYSLIRI